MSYPIAKCKCPTCGEVADGTVEIATGIAWFESPEDGDDYLEHSGETSLDDGQETKHRGAATVFYCGKHGEFYVEVDTDRVKYARRFAEEDWRQEVGEGNTRLGYDDWLSHMIASAKDDERAAAKKRGKRANKKGKASP